MKKIIIKNGGKTISLNVKGCGLIGTVVGLMFSKKENAKTLLLLDFKKPRRAKIHSFFVFSTFACFPDQNI